MNRHTGRTPPRSPARPRTLLFVCTGNICRSPLAAALAARLLAGMQEPSPDAARSVIRTVSAGTHVRRGTPATVQARRVGRVAGVDLDSHRATPLTKRMLEAADLVLCMEESHMTEAARLAPGQVARIALLDPEGREIADPYGLGPDAYQLAYEQIAAALRVRLPDLLA